MGFDGVAQRHHRQADTRTDSFSLLACARLSLAVCKYQGRLRRARDYSILNVMRRSDCPLAATLDLIGDRWTLVVLRDIVLAHRYGFSQIAAEEGIATNILMDRLDRLVAAGLLERHVDSADRRRRTYLPTERAIGLVPVLVDLLVWGNANTGATGKADMAEAVRNDRDAVIGKLESTARDKVAAARV